MCYVRQFRFFCVLVLHALVRFAGLRATRGVAGSVRAPSCDVTLEGSN